MQIFLVIAFSFFIMALPAYLRHTNLSETKFASSDLGFENPDQENRVPDNEKELKAFGPTGLFTIFILGTHLSERPSHLFSQILSLRQKNLVLRC